MTPYSLNLQPKRSSRLARYVSNTADLPDSNEQQAIDPVLLAHQRLASVLGEEEAEILGLMGRTRQKKGWSLGRVKDLKIEAGVFDFSARDEEEREEKEGEEGGGGEKQEPKGAAEKVSLGVSEATAATHRAEEAAPAPQRLRSNGHPLESVNIDGTPETIALPLQGRKRRYPESYKDEMQEKHPKRYHDGLRLR